MADAYRSTIGSSANKTVTIWPCLATTCACHRLSVHAMPSLGVEPTLSVYTPKPNRVDLSRTTSITVCILTSTRPRVSNRPSDLPLLSGIQRHYVLYHRAPYRLFHPVLPYRHANKLKFLCVEPVWKLRSTDLWLPN